jgi:hypothetical protein
MKFRIALIVLLLSVFSTRFLAQPFEGVVNGTVTAISVPDEMKGMEAMFNQTITAYYKGEKMRMELAGAMQSTIVISDYGAKEVTVLMNMMGNKWAMKETLTDEDMPGMSMEFEGAELEFSDETRTIAGQTCKKVVIRAPKEEGQEEPFVMTMWYAPISHSKTKNHLFPELPWNTKCRQVV